MSIVRQLEPELHIDGDAKTVRPPVGGRLTVLRPSLLLCACAYSHCLIQAQTLEFAFPSALTRHSCAAPVCVCGVGRRLVAHSITYTNAQLYMPCEAARCHG